MAPAAPGCAEGQEDPLVFGRRTRQPVAQNNLGVLGRDRIAVQEFLDATGIMMVAGFERVGPLSRDDLAIGVEHAQKRKADALLKLFLAQRGLALLEEVAAPGASVSTITRTYS